MPLKENIATRFRDKIQGKIRRGELPIEEAYIKVLQVVLGLTMVPGSLGDLHTIMSSHFKLEPIPDIDHVAWWSEPKKSTTETFSTSNPNPVTPVSGARPRMYQPTSKRNSDGELVDKSD